MNIKKWILIITLLAIVSVGMFWLLSNQPKHANGETTVKRETFYLGQKIYDNGWNEIYYFHGFIYSNSVIFMQIGHLHVGLYAAGMSDITFRADNNYPTFTLDDRTFTIVDSTQDSVTLEWKEG